MTRRRTVRKRLLALLLILACLPGVGLLALQRDDPDLLVLRLAGGKIGATPAQTAANGIEPNAAQPNLAPPESRFAVVALRPLFVPTRRPPDRPEDPAAAPPVAAAPPDLLVTGIVLAGADSLAILEPARPGAGAETALVARIGDSVDGWAVEMIEPGMVVIARDGTRHEMPLIDEDDPRRASAARRAPAPRTHPQRPAAPKLQPRPPVKQAPETSQ